MDYAPVSDEELVEAANEVFLACDEIQQLWVEEAEARYADFIAGRTSAVDGDEVFTQARTRKRRTFP